MRKGQSLFGERSSLYEDGETYVYLTVYEGDGHALLGRKKSISDNSVALKIGVSNNPERRRDELNAGFPPATQGQWGPMRQSQSFPSKADAEKVETLFKNKAAQNLESLGGEFFWGRQDDAESLFWSLPGMSRF